MNIKKVFKIAICVILLLCLCTVSVFAVTEDEVQSVVDEVRKDGVTGNILVWFLCVIAFLKVSQKIEKAIFIDECWQLIGSTGNRIAAEFVLEIFKIIRGYIR